MQQTRNFLISGRVQGVGYRAFVRKHAAQLGVVGYAKNLPSGEVEVFATGSETALDTLRGYLHQGPRFSNVRKIEEREAAPASYDGFFVK